MVHAQCAGHLTEAEISAEANLTAAVDAQSVKDQKSQRDKANVRKLRMSKITKPTVCWEGKKLFIEDSLMVTGVLWHIQNLGAERVLEHSKADIFVLSDIDLNIHDNGVQFAVRLLAAAVVSSEFFYSGGSRGALIKYKGGVHVRRKVLATQRFMVAHCSACQILLDIMKLPVSRWRFTDIARALHFLGAAGKKQDEKQRKILALVTPEDQYDGNELGCIQHQLTMAQFFENRLFSCVDETGLIFGIGRL